MMLEERELMKTCGTTTRLLLIVSLLTIVFTSACSAPKPGTYKTPEEAVRAFGSLLGVGTTDQYEVMFGPGALETLLSGDETADHEDALRIKQMIQEKISFMDVGEHKVALVGEDEWSFPIPLIMEEDRWRFDMAEGREELLNRRIGRNELFALASLREYVEAQKEYASEGRDGKPPAFAQTFRSSEGLHDGLYWPTAEGEPLSPLGDLLAIATKEGYTLAEGEGPEPFHGYYFRILTGQGPNGAGGARSYLDKNGLMTGGFAVIAWPAKYGNSGIMTFQVDRRRIVFQKDLGPDTESIVKGIQVYDPDDTWDPTGD